MAALREPISTKMTRSIDRLLRRRSDEFARRRVRGYARELALEGDSQGDAFMPTPSKRPDTIVLVHGFWVTPRSWEHWIPRYQARGYRVLAPAYPGFEVEVEALNRDPSPVERL